MLRIIFIFTVTLLYLAGCNLMSDLSRAATERIVVARGITGLWYAADFKNEQDSFSVSFGKETYWFSRQQMDSGISCTSVMAGFRKFADSNFRLDLKLDRRHLLFTAVQYSEPDSRMQYSIENDNWKFIDTRHAKVHCSGSSFDLTDRTSGLCLGLRLGESNSIFLTGSFLFRQSAVLVTDSSVRSVLKTDPDYNSLLSDYAIAHYSRFNAP